VDWVFSGRVVILFSLSVNCIR